MLEVFQKSDMAAIKRKKLLQQKHPKCQVLAIAWMSPDISFTKICLPYSWLQAPLPFLLLFFLFSNLFAKPRWILQPMREIKPVYSSVCSLLKCFTQSLLANQADMRLALTCGTQLFCTGKSHQWRKWFPAVVWGLAQHSDLWWWHLVMQNKGLLLSGCQLCQFV